MPRGCLCSSSTLDRKSIVKTSFNQKAPLIKFLFLARWSQNSTTLEWWAPVFKGNGLKTRRCSPLRSPGCTHGCVAVLTLLMGLPITSECFWQSRKKSWLFCSEVYITCPCGSQGRRNSGPWWQGPCSCYVCDWELILWERPQIFPVKRLWFLVILWSPAMGASPCLGSYLCFPHALNCHFQFLGKGWLWRPIEVAPLCLDIRSESLSLLLLL